MLRFLMLSLVDFLPAGTRMSAFKLSVCASDVGFFRCVKYGLSDFYFTSYGLNFLSLSN